MNLTSYDVIDVPSSFHHFLLFHDTKGFQYTIPAANAPSVVNKIKGSKSRGKMSSYIRGNASGIWMLFLVYCYCKYKAVRIYSKIQTLKIYWLQFFKPKRLDSFKGIIFPIKNIFSYFFSNSNILDPFDSGLYLFK